MSDSLRIYVACLASYNNGVLHGAWIDCDGASADDLQTEINKILRASKFPNVTVTDDEGNEVPSAEEFAIHDSEGFFSLVGEYTSLADIALAAEMIAEHGEAYALYAADIGGNTLPDSDDFTDHYHGEWDSFKAYAENYVDDSGMLVGVDETLARYFDYEAFARDLEHDYHTERMSNGNVAVFTR